MKKKRVMNWVPEVDGMKWSPEMRCLKCGRQHPLNRACPTQTRITSLLSSLAVSSEAATAAETMNIQQYIEWRNNGRQKAAGGWALGFE